MHFAFVSYLYDGVELRISTSRSSFSINAMDKNNCRYIQLRLLLCVASFNRVISFSAASAVSNQN